MIASKTFVLQSVTPHNALRRRARSLEDALTVLAEAISDADDGSLPTDGAKAVFAEDDRFSESEAAHALYMLDNRDRIYSVDDRVRITPTDE